MPSTYSPDLRIELIANGEQDGTWGTTTNLNLGTLIEQAIAGVATVATSSAAQALTVQNGASDESRCSVLSLSTLGGMNYAVYVPPVPKLYVVKNADTLYNLTLYVSTIAGNTTAAGSGVTLAPGKTALLRSDGTNIIDQINYVSGGFGVGGALAVTGAATFGNTVTLNANPTLNLQAATKQYVDTTVAGGIPSGCILLWSGLIAAIPAGWYLCNGLNGTPDLRNTFVIGAYSDQTIAGSNTAAVTLPGLTGSQLKSGGSANSDVISHTHTYSTTTGSNGNHRHGLFGGTGGSTAVLGVNAAVISGLANYTSQGRYVYSYSGYDIMEEAGSHTHSVSGTTASSGSSGTNANLPPYYALAYIMKA